VYPVYIKTVFNKIECTITSIFSLMSEPVMVDVTSIACMCVDTCVCQDYSGYIKQCISRRIQYVRDSHMPNKPSNPFILSLESQWTQSFLKGLVCVLYCTVSPVVIESSTPAIINDSDRLKEEWLKGQIGEYA